MNVEIKLTTEDVIKAVSGMLVNGDMGIPFRGVSTDTRIIKPGYLFWALKGKNFDGHDFWQTAIKKGAKGLVISYFPQGFVLEKLPRTISVILVRDTLKALGDLAHWWRKKLNFHAVAITGSCGKTTTKEFVYAILSKYFKTSKNIANYNNLIGVPLSILSFKEGIEIGILELATNTPGEIETLAKIVNPQTSVITSIYPAHLEGLKSIEGVLKEKIELFKNTDPNGTLIYNFDNEILREKVKEFSQKKISFGMDNNADISFQDIKIQGEKLKVNIRCKENFYPLEIQNIGTHNLYNLCGALAIAYNFGLDLKDVLEKIKDEIPNLVRMKFISKKNYLIIDDTYNANPGSMKAVLKFLADISKNYEKILVILGDMKELGEESEKFHKEIGEIAGKIADWAIFIGEMAPYYAEGFAKFKNTFKTFNTVEEFSENLEIPFKKGVILVKASRALELERVVEKLKEVLE